MKICTLLVALTIVSSATASQFDNSTQCQVCEHVYEVYGKAISRGNSTVAAAENFGLALCNTIGSYDANQKAMCEKIVTEVDVVRKAFVDKVTPEHFCEDVKLCKPAPVMQAPPADKKNCPLCQKVVEAIQAFDKLGKHASSAGIDFGKGMCKVLAPVSKESVAECESIANMVEEFKDSVIDTLYPTQICHKINVC